MQSYFDANQADSGKRQQDFAQTKCNNRILLNLNLGAPTSLQQLKEEDPDLHSFLERFPFPTFSNFIFSDYILNVFVVSTWAVSRVPSDFYFHLHTIFSTQVFWSQSMEQNLPLSWGTVECLRSSCSEFCINWVHDELLSPVYQRWDSLSSGRSQLGCWRWREG